MVFPLAVAHRNAAGADEGIFPRLFRNPDDVDRFSVPFVIQMLTGLHHYFFFVPEIRTLRSIAFFATPLSRRIRQLAIIGSRIFNLNVAFSICFFIC